MAAAARSTPHGTDVAIDELTLACERLETD